LVLCSPMPQPPRGPPPPPHPRPRLQAAIGNHFHTMTSVDHFRKAELTVCDVLGFDLVAFTPLSFIDAVVEALECGAETREAVRRAAGAAALTNLRGACACVCAVPAGLHVPVGWRLRAGTCEKK
jgi:hypothetical protein